METATAKALVQAARSARDNAYAPYSQYRVGCAVQTANGAIFSGANVENASYGLCICAERSAIVQAVSAGHREITMVAIVTQSSPPASPCGMCRQTISEFATDLTKVTILLANLAGEEERVTLAELLPRSFGKSAL